MRVKAGMSQQLNMVKEIRKTINEAKEKGIDLNEEKLTNLNSYLTNLDDVCNFVKDIAVKLENAKKAEELKNAVKNNKPETKKAKFKEETKVRKLKLETEESEEDLDFLN